LTGFTLGIIEGFFGREWSWQARCGMAGFLASQGCNSYIYAPKADIWLRRDWASPFPAEHMLALQQLADTCHQHHLHFGVGLSPMELYRDFNQHSRKTLADKLTALKSLRLDLLCILFDDMRGDLPDLAERQLEVIDFVASKAVAPRLAVCPTYYSSDPILEKVFGTMPADYLENLGNSLDHDIDIFWTGPKVLSSRYPVEHLQLISQKLKRKPLIWDNYPVNDGKQLVDYLHLRAFHPEKSVLAEWSAGHFANPMNQPWLSRIPLFGMSALYGKQYDPERVLEDACISLCGPTLGKLILEDVPLFQDTGLARLTSAQRTALKTRYQPFSRTGYGKEVMDWLDGAYAFDPACLT
jgi:hyaluronoglucosaminidase